MRYFSPLFLLALVVSGCGGFDCDFGDSYQTVEDRASVSGVIASSDTLTVVFDLPYPAYQTDIWVRVGAETPQTSGTSRLDLALDATYSGYDAERVPAFQTETRNDTLVVTLAPVEFAEAPACPQQDGLVQPVCSLAEPSLRLDVLGVTAPEGVRHVRFAVQSHGYFRSLAPTASPPRESSRPASGRTARA